MKTVLSMQLLTCIFHTYIILFHIILFELMILKEKNLLSFNLAAWCASSSVSVSHREEWMKGSEKGYFILVFQTGPITLEKGGGGWGNG